MKTFAAILKDKKSGTLSDELLQKHVDHLRQLNKSGTLLLCGPFKDNDRALQILVSESADEAVQLIESDPFIKEGYYGSYELNELLVANEENDWLMDIPQTKQNLHK